MATRRQSYKRHYHYKMTWKGEHGEPKVEYTNNMGDAEYFQNKMRTKGVSVKIEEGNWVA